MRNVSKLWKWDEVNKKNVDWHVTKEMGHRKKKGRRHNVWACSLDWFGNEKFFNDKVGISLTFEYHATYLLLDQHVCFCYFQLLDEIYVIYDPNLIFWM